MNKKSVGIFFLILSALTIIFFYKVFFLRQIPFPGDLLVNTNPFKTESYLGYSPSGYPNKAQGPDVIYEIYPWRYYSINELKQGTIPFWNPHNFSGNLQLQNYQTGLFYPLNFFYFIMPFNNAWTLIIISQPLLAGIFMYLFLKDLGNKEYAAGIGSVAFAFSSYMTVWLEYGNIGSTFLWLPLLLLLIRRFMQTDRLRYMVLAVLSLATAFLAGYIQGVFYLYVIIFSYLCFLFFKEKKRINKWFIISTVFIFCLPLVLTSYQIIPTVVLYLDSTRSDYTSLQIQQLLQPFYYWLTLFIPDFFGNPATRNMWVPLTYIERVMYPGVSILFFTLFTIWKVHHKEKIYFTLLCGIILFLTTNFPGVFYFYHIPIPTISTTVPTRALSIFIFSAIVLATFGISDWMEEKKKQTFLLPLMFIGIYLVFWVAVFVLPKFYPGLKLGLAVAKHNLIFPTMLAVITSGLFILRQKFSKISYTGLTCIVVFDLLYFFLKITPFTPQSLIYPQTPVMSYLHAHGGINRFWGYGDAYIPPNFQSVDDTYSPEGNDPLHILSYGILLTSSKDGMYPKILPRPDANIAPGYGPNDLRNNKFRQTILNLLGIKYVLHLDQRLSDTWVPNTATFDPDIYQLVWQQKPWQIYENKKALPRFFIISDYQVVTDKKKELSAFYHTDLSKTIILEKQPSLYIDKYSHGSTELLQYGANTVSIRTKTNGSALLFLSDNYTPIWQVKLDGKSIPLYRADFSFRAVPIPAGEHIVVFSYAHSKFTLGLILAGIGMIVLIIYPCVLFRYGKKI